MTDNTMPLRFGLVGTGYWAREVHAAGVAGHPDAELVAVWGRDREKSAALADQHGAASFAGEDEFGAMLEAVDAVVFSVPPSVQAPLALRAAEAGRHLLLEKPVALDPEQADAIAGAAQASGVASVVFFTERFVPERESWLQERAEAGSLGGHASWLASLRNPGNPFAHSAWRQQEGALWDVGPHALSVLIPVLGPVRAVAGARGADDLVHLVFSHDGGATSTAALSLTMPPAATREGLSFYDEHGWHDRPDSGQAASGDVVSHQQRAVTDLVANARAGSTEHRCDVRFGAEVVRVLARAQRVLDAQASQPSA